MGKFLSYAFSKARISGTGNITEGYRIRYRIPRNDLMSLANATFLTTDVHDDIFGGFLQAHYKHLFVRIRGYYIDISENQRGT